MSARVESTALPVHPTTSRGRPEPATPGDATRQFEVLLARELLRAMRATVDDDGPGTGSAFGRDTLHAMFDDRLADGVAGHLGLARAVARQLEPGATPAAPVISPVRLTPPAPRPHGRLAVGAAAFAGPGLPPADGPVSSPFGRRVHPVTGTPSFHEGLDIAAPLGSEIRAVRAGTVVHAGPMGSYGLTVEIDHGDGLRTRYAHASRLHVRRGQRVDAGEAVADVGATGRATGPHLHLEVRRHGRAIDPAPVLRALGLSPPRAAAPPKGAS